MIEHNEPTRLLVRRLVASVGRETAHKAIDVMLAKFTNVELSALAATWSMWARSKQMAPEGEWLSWGHLTARGTGKTKAISHHIADEVQAGRCKRIGLAAQKEDKSIEAQIAALIAASPPWFAPRWEASALQLAWPNGARAIVFTPEVPGAIRSENFDLVWLSELQSWPVATREEAYSNFMFATRVGYARTVWDSTPKRGHPILKRLLARAAEDPAKHHVIRGTIYENPWLAASAVAEMEREYGGTTKGREELLGEMLDDSESALIKQIWIDNNRRPMPDAFERRVITIDPAITSRSGSDQTGILDVALDADGRMLVIRDLTAKHKPDAWGKLVLDAYEAGSCDLVLVETNRGGDLVTQNLRAHADRRKLRVIVLGKDEKPHRAPGVVYVKEIHARGPKEERATPLATAYERGRVSHVIGADLTDLEETLTSWEPQAGQRSPDRLDPLAHAATELLGLLENRPDGKRAFVGLAAMSRGIATPNGSSINVAALLGGGGGRI